ncbi:uncharacterized protein V1516DRAFT_668161 [Lipomyces oligophaga]|uniref:uncharacterized protein n=1 Tax=Lipomyces oligophaga TaxID=45792 RepID=UPI0034CE8F9D
MALVQYPALYVILGICIFAVIRDEMITRPIKIGVLSILILFFPSVDLYVYSRRRRGIPDDYKYYSSDEENDEEEDMEEGKEASKI